jgi:hypothetical protein
VAKFCSECGEPLQAGSCPNLCDPKVEDVTETGHETEPLGGVGPNPRLDGSSNVPDAVVSYPSEEPRTYMGAPSASEADVVRAYTHNGVTDWDAVRRYETSIAAAEQIFRELPAKMAEASRRSSETIAEMHALPRGWEANPFGVSGRVIRGWRHWRNKR